VLASGSSGLPQSANQKTEQSAFGAVKFSGAAKSKALPLTRVDPSFMQIEFFSGSGPVQDLLHRAKHSFVGAIGG